MGSNVKLLRTCQSHMALKAGCCVLGFPSGPAEHLNRMEDSALVRLMLSTCFCRLRHLIKSQSMSLPGLL
ncbi:Uncharacterized protein TPS_02861 [Trichinella pseudospiralis]